MCKEVILIHLNTLSDALTMDLVHKVVINMVSVSALTIFNNSVRKESYCV